MRNRIYAASSKSFKILNEEDIEYFNKATEQGRNYTACKKIGKKYIPDKDMYEWFESELEGRLFNARQLDALIADELENEYVYNISDDDEDDEDNWEDNEDYKDDYDNDEYEYEDPTYFFSVYELDDEGEELDMVAILESEEAAIAKAKDLIKEGIIKQAHVVLVPDQDPDDDPAIAEWYEYNCEYEPYEVVWSSI